MPKVLSEYEKAQTRNAILESTKQLICANHSIKNITVDDIVKAVNIGKGSFYSYFNSKEECLYAVIKKGEQELIEQFDALMKHDDMDHRKKLTSFLRDVYLSENNISRHINGTDLEMLLRKLPPEYNAAHKEKSRNYITVFQKALNLGMTQMEAVASLLDCLGFVNANTFFSTQGKYETINTLISTIVNYIEENGGEEEIGN